MATSDSELLVKVATEQCEESYRRIFSKFAPKIYAFAIAQKMSEPQARDLVQDTMTAVWTKARMFNADKGQPSTWIYTIARNLRYDLLRKHVREARVISSEDLYEIPLSETDTRDDGDLVQRLQDKELSELVQSLPENQKLAVEAVFFSGFTHEEYASNENIPLGTVKSRIRLALRKLNQLLGEQ